MIKNRRAVNSFKVSTSLSLKLKFAQGLNGKEITIILYGIIKIRVVIFIYIFLVEKDGQRYLY